MFHESLGRTLLYIRIHVDGDLSAVSYHFGDCYSSRLIAGTLEVLELSFNIPSNDENRQSLKATAIDVASQLLVLPTPPSVQMHTTALLATLHPSKQAYHIHKVHSTCIAFRNIIRDHFDPIFSLFCFF